MENLWHIQVGKKKFDYVEIRGSFDDYIKMLNEIRDWLDKIPEEFVCSEWRTNMKRLAVNKVVEMTEQQKKDLANLN